MYTYIHTYIHTFIHTYICGGSAMLGQTSGVSFPLQNKEKRFISMHVRKPLVFDVQPNNLLTSVLYIFIRGGT